MTPAKPATECPVAMPAPPDGDEGENDDKRVLLASLGEGDRRAGL